MHHISFCSDAVLQRSPPMQAGSPSGHCCLRPRCSRSGRADLRLWRMWPPPALPSLHVALPSIPRLFHQSAHDCRSGPCGPYHVSLGEGVGGGWGAAASLDGLWRPAPVWAVRRHSRLLVLHPCPASTSSVARGNCDWRAVVHGGRVFGKHIKGYQVGASLWPHGGVLGKPGGNAAPIHRSGSMLPATSWHCRCALKSFVPALVVSMFLSSREAKAHQQHSVRRKSAPTNGLFCLCYNSFRIDELLLHFLAYLGKGRPIKYVIFALCQATAAVVIRKTRLSLAFKGTQLSRLSSRGSGFIRSNLEKKGTWEVWAVSSLSQYRARIAQNRDSSTTQLLLSFEYRNATGNRKLVVGVI